MKKIILTGMLLSSYALMAYSTTKFVKSIKNFNNSIISANFSNMRKETNHIIDSIEFRKM